MKLSLQSWLLIAGIIFIPFYEVILKVFPFVIVASPDTRASKELVAMMFALAIGLLAIFQGALKPFKNKFILILILFLLLNLSLAPKISLFINGIDSGDFYFWRPFGQVLCFALMLFAVASMAEDITLILKVMVGVAFAMAIYVIIQKFGFDQFWIVKNNPKELLTEPALAGNLGNSTIVAAFMVIVVPLAIYFKKWWKVTVIAIATILTQSDMAIIAMILLGILSFSWNSPILVIALFIVAFLLMILIMGHSGLRHKISDRSNGRIPLWKEVYKDIRDGPIQNIQQDFSYTGVGLGRFPFIFPTRHQSIFRQVHNEPLEFFYNTGLVGIGLAIAAFVSMVIRVFKTVNPLSFAIFVSFLGVLLVSLGCFPFQLGPHQFYSIILLGLLHNDRLANE